MSPRSQQSAPRVEIAVAVVEDESRYLIGRRHSGEPLAGYWEFPGGKIQPGESPEAAAVRECLEETGLLVAVVGRHGQVEHDYPHGALRLHFCACRPVAPQRPLPERFRWVGAAHLADYSFPAANTRLLESLIASRANPAAS